MLNKRDKEKETRRKSANQSILISHQGATLDTNLKRKMAANKLVRHLDQKIELKSRKSIQIIIISRLNLRLWKNQVILCLSEE